MIKDDGINVKLIGCLGGGGERPTGRRQGRVRVRRHRRRRGQRRHVRPRLRSAADAPLRHDGTQGNVGASSLASL